MRSLPVEGRALSRPVSGRHGGRPSNSLSAISGCVSAAEERTEDAADNLPPDGTADGAGCALGHRLCHGVRAAAAGADRGLENFTEEGVGLRGPGGGRGSRRARFLDCARLEFFVGRFAVDGGAVVLLQAGGFHDGGALLGGDGAELTARRRDLGALDDAGFAIGLEHGDERLADA